MDILRAVDICFKNRVLLFEDRGEYGKFVLNIFAFDQELSFLGDVEKTIDEDWVSIVAVALMMVVIFVRILEPLILFILLVGVFLSNGLDCSARNLSRALSRLHSG